MSKPARRASLLLFVLLGFSRVGFAGERPAAHSDDEMYFVSQILLVDEQSSPDSVDPKIIKKLIGLHEELLKADAQAAPVLAQQESVPSPAEFVLEDLEINKCPKLLHPVRGCFLFDALEPTPT